MSDRSCLFYFITVNYIWLPFQCVCSMVKIVTSKEKDQEVQKFIFKNIQMTDKVTIPLHNDIDSSLSFDVFHKIILNTKY